MDVEPQEPPASRRRPFARGIAELVRTLLLAGLVFVGARTVVLPFQVDGASMSPNLHDRERVLVNRTVYFHFDLYGMVNVLPGVELEGSREVFPFHPPERGDVVVLNPPVSAAQPYIKRVIGLPGESVRIARGGVYVDGRRLEEPYLAGLRTECAGTPHCSVERIPAGYVYVLGDNRGNSTDSRSFGLVEVEEIVGKAWFTNWPLNDMGRIPHYDYKQ